MSAEEVGTDLAHSAGASFTTTHWSVVLQAGQSDSPDASAALERLCRTYWYPLYAYVRRCGYSAEDAQDLTQEFFACLLSKDYLGRADPLKGKFRSFLLIGLRHVLCDERDKARRLKRGGGQMLIPLDAQAAEERYRLEPSDATTPENLFERNWALALLERAIERLREEYERSGKAALFEQLTEFRWDATPERPYSAVARHLGLSENAVKSAIHRLRLRHQELVRDEIAQTVSDPAAVDEEIRHLLQVLAR